MNIRLVITDIDGVWTDGGMYYAADGGEWKRFNTADSEGVLYCKAAELELAILTGEDTPIVQRRAEKLGIERVYTGVKDKLGRAEKLCAELGISLEETAFIGDGISDLSLLRRVGFAATVPDAPRYIREVAHYVTGTRGGHGAFREFVTQILGRAGTLEKARERVVRELTGGAGAE